MNLTSVVPADLPLDAVCRGSFDAKLDGVVRRLDLGDLAHIDVSRIGPIRSSASYKDRPNYAG